MFSSHELEVILSGVIAANIHGKKELMEPSCLGNLIIMEDPFLHDFGALCRAVKPLLGEERLTLKYTYL